MLMTYQTPFLFLDFVFAFVFSLSRFSPPPFARRGRSGICPLARPAEIPANAGRLVVPGVESGHFLKGGLSRGFPKRGGWSGWVVGWVGGVG